MSTEDLTRLLRALHRGTLTCPITRIALAQAGLLGLGDDLAALRGHEGPAVTAILVAVLAERQRISRRS